MKAFIALFRTEAKLAVRSLDMVFFGLCFPVGVMALIGVISGKAAAATAFAGVACVGICASGLMGIPLTFASYRHEKILKRLRVTPVSPILLMLAATLVQTIFAWLSGLAVYLLARAAFAMEPGGSPLRFALDFLFVQATIYSLGFLVASLAPNEKIANLACTALYFPMLFLSGATIPYEIMPAALKAFAGAFPLTQGIIILKGAALGIDPAPDAERMLALAAVAAISYLASFKCFRWE